MEELEKNPEMDNIPIVLVTAVNTPATTIKANKLGVEFRLAKPWVQGQLDSVFKNALNLSQVT